MRSEAYLSSFVVEVKGSEIVPAGESISLLCILIGSRKLRYRVYYAISSMSIHILGQE
jgi:hypothetical protein